MQKEFFLLRTKIILMPNTHTFWTCETSNIKLDDPMQQLHIYYCSIIPYGVTLIIMQG